ncbi:MAG: 50S ribosomal protein L29 [Candidatus Saccharibacteria bacterium]|jgi:ribosomal protein L29|nr:50S ribosomal protein L29 [Candidatus Saccharibacteria bacterium]
MKKVEEIRNMKVDELVKETSTLREEIAEMKRRIHMGEVQNPRVIRLKRRELARMLTILGEHLVKEKA